ncbi:MAG: uroporphyrinogen decarboxylase family protein [Candidatus Hydrogenedentota bacterium]
MPQSHDENGCLFLRAARGERTERTPVWLMRQAGRTDPAYNRLKAEADLPLEKLFRHPAYAAEISLLPRRFGVDAIIIFQDILTILSAMGAPFVFRPGPELAQPAPPEELAQRLHGIEPPKDLAFVGETFQRIHATIEGALPVLGFAGAPLTLLVFLAEGKSFGSQAPATQDFLRREPETAHRLLDLLTEATIAYLRYQIAAGAAAVQLFESAAFLFDRNTYTQFALPAQRRIFSALKGTAPTIHFARGLADLDLLDHPCADIISLPAGVSIAGARAALGDNAVLQGNLGNELLAHGTWPEIEAAAVACLEQGAHEGHIFNLSHGLLRDTPFEHVTRLVQLVRDYRIEA